MQVKRAESWRKLCPLGKRGGSEGLVNLGRGHRGENAGLGREGGLYTRMPQEEFREPLWFLSWASNMRFNYSLEGQRRSVLKMEWGGLRRQETQRLLQASSSDLGHLQHSDCCHSEARGLSNDNRSDLFIFQGQRKRGCIYNAFVSRSYSMLTFF